MNKDSLFMSNRGEIGPLSYWEGQLKTFWRTLGTEKDLLRNGFRRPDDALSRMFRVLGVKEITTEE